MVAGPPPVTAPRLAALDGLRGLAAVIVLVHHSLLLVPSLAQVYFPRSDGASVSVATAVLAYSPLHVLWAGTEAVYLFFVLSGMVLLLPVLRRGRAFDWVGYYPRRIVRIYGPVWVAVALGALTFLLVPRVDDPALGPWADGRPKTYPLDRLWLDLSLVAGPSGRISPLWSLQWEVLFSLLLPLYALFVLLVPRLDVAKAVLSFALIVIGAVLEIEALFFLPMFAVGGLLIANWDRIEAGTRRLAAGRAWFWPLVAVLGVLLVCARWEAVALGVDPEAAWRLGFLAVPGAVLVVLAAALSPGGRRLFEHRALQWAGRISFSLYLVHEPILLSARSALPDASPALVIALAVPVAIGLSVLFERVVESRFHALSRATGRWTAARAGRTA